MITSGLTCIFVRKEERQSQRWNFGVSSRRRKDRGAFRRARMSSHVFYQSLWYVLSFLLTLPFLMISYYLEFKSEWSYWILFLSGVFAPIQGLLNAAIYHHRHYVFAKMRDMLWRCQAIHNANNYRRRQEDDRGHDAERDSAVSRDNLDAIGGSRVGFAESMMLKSAAEDSSLPTDTAVVSYLESSTSGSRTRKESETLSYSGRNASSYSDYSDHNAIGQEFDYEDDVDEYDDAVEEFWDLTHPNEPFEADMSTTSTKEKAEAPSVILEEVCCDDGENEVSTTQRTRTDDERENVSVQELHEAPTTAQQQNEERMC